jgi:hypothetical protein
MEHGSYVIDGKAARRYRAVGVALLDLQISKRMIDRCVTDREDQEDEALEDEALYLEEAFWTTALIRFRRAFTKGRGTDWGHGELLSRLAPEHRASHERFYMLADKFIAHPVGIGEDMAVTAVLGPGIGDSIVVYGGALRKRRVSSPGTDLAKELRALLEELIALVAARENTAHREFLEEIRTWAPAELLRGGMYESEIHFDEASELYRRTLKTYRQGAAND